MPEGWGFCILTRACYWGHAIHRSHRSRTKGSVGCLCFLGLHLQEAVTAMVPALMWLM